MEDKKDRIQDTFKDENIKALCRAVIRTVQDGNEEILFRLLKEQFRQHKREVAQSVRNQTIEEIKELSRKDYGRGTVAVIESFADFRKDLESLKKASKE